MREPNQHPGRPADPCAMVICGASGDLTKRKLIPALYNLANDHLLSSEFAIVGFARNDLDTGAFRRQLTEDIKTFATGSVDAEIWEWLLGRTYYVPGDFKDPKAYQKLKEAMAQEIRSHSAHGNVLYYLATAPSLFAEIVRQLGAAGLAHEEDGRWRRVIIEKPFGRDLESARALNAEINEALKERQIYRIDHYLGKETVQNILAFRFGNGIFEPVWNRRYIDHIQITAAESVGVEQRGEYYETSGALRDMVPNHLSQLLSLTAMEPPVSFDADKVRDEQAKVLHAIQPLTPEEVLSKTVRGQYGPGMNGEAHVPAYREELSVAHDSNMETFVALKLNIDNWRWADIPFYLRTGKRLPKRVTEIVVQFRRAPFVLFRNTPVDQLNANRLVIHIQPDEGISLRFGAKIPGPIMQMGAVNMDFDYADYFGCRPSTGYERLLYDSMCGDATLFQRTDMVETGWKIVSPIQDVWSALPPRSFPNYPAETWGPKEAHDLLARDGREWRLIE